ncbi:sphingomyelin phosphodiesterase 3 isoform X1 [Petromyzon marinus]|uniref:sphingomyelin phosphodiesterase 3 isoform X1 n=1 Tax=Petromyzon marinus TaxID=7757 RepID=UPI003F71F4B2
MALHTSPFPNAFLRAVHAAAWLLIVPCYWLCDRLLAALISGTCERRRRRRRDGAGGGAGVAGVGGGGGGDARCLRFLFAVVVAAPLYLALLAASLPLALLGFAAWAPLQLARRAYAYAGCPDPALSAAAARARLESRPLASGRSFAFATANVRLPPDSLARVGNLPDTQWRAREIGRRVRTGASRPQIKIYVDSPTNTSISAASWSSLLVVSSQGGGADSAGPSPTVSLRRACAMDGGPRGRAAVDSASPSPVIGHRERADAERDGSACVDLSGIQLVLAEPPAGPEADGKKTVTYGEEQQLQQRGGGGGAMTQDSRASSKESLSQPPRSPDWASTDPTGWPTRFVYKPSVMKKSSMRRKKPTDEPFDYEISSFFPANLDFLCLQEVFDKRAAEKLRTQLQAYFQYVLYDVGVYGFHGCSFKFFNSGLFFASCYPILDADYRCFPNAKGADVLVSKGALFVKVQVGTTAQERRLVGFVSCTHTQAAEAGHASVRCEQLDLLVQWQAEFRKECSGEAAGSPASRDIVLFDVMCGDLNFDNCSMEDKLEQHHPLFTHYRDPCRQGPGEEKTWAIGTLLDQEGLYDEEVASPENLQKVLENEEGRKSYLVFPSSKSPRCDQGGRPVPLRGSGRRLDYMLHTEESSLECRTEVEEYSFITQLAGLTDHLPVAMRLLVSSLDEEP